MPVGPCRGLQVPSGPQRYAEAARTFEELLLQDGSYVEAATQLEACRAQLQVRPPLSQPPSPVICPAVPPTPHPCPLTAVQPPWGCPCVPLPAQGYGATVSPW